MLIPEDCIRGTVAVNADVPYSPSRPLVRSFLLCKKHAGDKESDSEGSSSTAAPEEQKAIDKGVTTRAFKYNAYEWPLMLLGMWENACVT